MKTIIKSKLFVIAIVGILCGSSCKSLLPEDLDAFGEDVLYSITEFTPIIGRKTVYENAANLGNSSSLPLEFKLLNVRTTEGTAATELTDKFPIKIWKKAYTGTEKSIEEIESKREVQYRSILEIGKNSGDIIMWDFGSSDWIRTQPDSCYVFDVEISNSGGRRYARNLKLKPQKQRAYEPSQYDPVTGLAKFAALRPSTIQNLFGETTNNLVYDIETYVFKDESNKTPGGSLTISMLDSLNRPLDVSLFSDTKWGDILHAFAPEFKDNKVTYKVAYPIPLIKMATKYTNATGDQAKILLQKNRIGFGGLRYEMKLGFDFAIYEEGHWEIQFRFRGETPKFINE